MAEYDDPPSPVYSPASHAPQYDKPDMQPSQTPTLQQQRTMTETRPRPQIQTPASRDANINNTPTSLGTPSFHSTPSHQSTPYCSPSDQFSYMHALNHHPSDSAYQHQNYQNTNNHYGCYHPPTSTHYSSTNNYYPSTNNHPSTSTNTNIHFEAPTPPFSQTKTVQPPKTFTDLLNTSLPGASKDTRYDTFLAMFIKENYSIYVQPYLQT